VATTGVHVGVDVKVIYEPASDRIISGYLTSRWVDSMREPHHRSTIAELLNDSPVIRGEVIRNVREFLVVGEYALAFDTLCEWIYEDDLTISCVPRKAPPVRCRDECS